MMPKSNFDLVKEFHQAFNVDVKDKPKFPSAEIEVLRCNLIKEEVNELIEALEDRNIVEVADALGDLLYVVYGMGHAYGINLDACFAEIHASNMTKLGVDGKPIYREDGKVSKGPNFREPDLARVLDV
jgi:predicted HAD superfamily Cof-like phosphohydrolase